MLAGEGREAWAADEGKSGSRERCGDAVEQSAVVTYLSVPGVQ